MWVARYWVSKCPPPVSFMAAPPSPCRTITWNTHPAPHVMNRWPWDDGFFAYKADRECSHLHPFYGSSSGPNVTQENHTHTVRRHAAKLNKQPQRKRNRRRRSRALPPPPPLQSGCARSICASSPLGAESLGAWKGVTARSLLWRAPASVEFGCLALAVVAPGPEPIFMGVVPKPS